MKKEFRLVENTMEVNSKNFEYEEFMTLNQDGDQYPYIIATFNGLEEAIRELKKYNSTIRHYQHAVPYELVKEVYIEEVDFDDRGDECVNYNYIAPLKK